tara:strand:+ start:357 stop:695 length:339 start_codon:yes stop_codon:yes gene_type:complete
MTDTQLKQALAKMLPNQVEMLRLTDRTPYGLCWKSRGLCSPVLPAELLHLCWLVEETLPKPNSEAGDTDQMYINELGFTDDSDCYHEMFDKVCHASWQQRVIALCKVKGISI